MNCEYLIETCYKKVICKVWFLKNNSKPFDVKSGLHQRDICMSPTLFNPALEIIVKDMNKQQKI